MIASDTYSTRIGAKLGRAFASDAYSIRVGAKVGRSFFCFCFSSRSEPHGRASE